MEEVHEKCHAFLNTCLPLKSCYAGYESVKAISEMEKLNIITISEDGDSYMAVDYNENYKRTVFLAHRLGAIGKASGSTQTHNSHRDHYDSVSEITNGVLDKIVEFLNESRNRKAATQMNDNSVVNISDSTTE